MTRACRNHYRRSGTKGKRRWQSMTGAGVKIGLGRELDRKFEVLQHMLLGATVEAHAKVNSAFREELRKAILATVTDPEDMAVLPEFFPPSCRSIQ